jgi:hypothetical protein
MAEQQYLYDCYLTKSCNNGNLAAKPGYSNHQNGRAVDVSTSSWLFANAAKFGFVRTVPSEDWHWEYAGPDTGGPCSTSIEWVSPKDGGHYTNGIWFKARSSNAAVTKIAYWADKWKLGESSDKASDYPVRYTFGTLGDRSVTAKAYDASGTEISSSTISIKIFP